MHMERSIFYLLSLVENMAKKNRSRFPIAVVVTVTKRLKKIIYHFATAKLSI